VQRSFFYLVKTNPPTRDDFRSYFERGRVPTRASARQIEILKGVSMWATEQQTLALAARMRERYDFVAQLAIPESVRVVRQGQSEGHHHVYASPDELVRWVVRVSRAR